MLDQADNEYINEEDRVMKFNSQICTTKEQSERLLALGLNAETADMGLAGDIPIAIENWKTQDTTLINSPAWSLHRLLCLLPREYIYDVDFQRIMQDFVFGSQDMYDEMVSCIETLIEAGYFYKEYLEE